MPTKAEMKVLLDEARALVESLKVELGRVTTERDSLEGKLEETTEKLKSSEDQVEELRTSAEAQASVEALEDQVEEARWRLDEAERTSELTVLREKEAMRQEMLRVHKSDLESRDYLIQLLREKIDGLQRQTEGGDAAPDSRDTEPGTSTEEVIDTTPVMFQHPPRSSAIRLSEMLTKFSGEDTEDDGAFPRWLRRLERIAGLYKWSESEKLVQFELLLTGRAERLYELLPASDRESYKEATEALQKRLTPAGREALKSAQLMRRKQQANESVDTFAQDFERLFEQSYGRRQGMDESSCEMLKRDLFIQGLLLKWQEKVLPSAETFADALYQARSMEEQAKQLAKMHPVGGGQRNMTTLSKRPQEPNPSNQGQPPKSSKDGSRYKCHRCGSTRHFIRDCPMKKTTETPGQREPHTSNNISGGNQQSEDKRCEDLHQQWVDAEFTRLKRTVQVDNVTGSVGPLYYCDVEIAGQPVEALIDSGSSATVMTFSLYHRISRDAKLSVDVLEKPDVILRDYNQHPLRIGAVAKLEVAYKGKKVLTPVYINVDSEHKPSESCIVGTNLLFSLGILTVPGDVKNKGGDKEAGLVESGGAVASTVKLLRSEKIPARSGVVLRLTTDSTVGPEGSYYFRPHRTESFVAEEAVVKVERGKLSLPVMNLTNKSVELREDQELGYITETRVDDVGDLLIDVDSPEEEGTVAIVTSGGHTPMTAEERQLKLKSLLDKESKIPQSIFDYLTKWVEAFPTEDQTSETIANLLVDEIICRHGVPEQLLSDRGSNLLSDLMKSVYSLTGIQKINTTASHPQTDGLVENMNRTLRAMIAKYSSKYRDNWDEYLPKLLFAYRTKCHESTGESPFFLLYGRDAGLPGEEALSTKRTPYMVDITDYKMELMTSLTEAWEVARTCIDKAQQAQKKQRDKSVRVKPIQPGDRVMVFMPNETTGKMRKLARPYHGPYRVIQTHPNGVTVRPVDKPKDPSIRVNLERISLCPKELPDTSWLGKRRSRDTSHRDTCRP